MSDSILQKYLSLQFIPIDDDANLEKIKKAVEQLEKKIKKEKVKIVQFTLIALDPKVLPNEPVLFEVQEIITKAWPVYINKAGGENLVTYNRAVILQALDNLSNDIEFAGIIWLTGCSVIKHYCLGREEEILKAWLHSIGKIYQSKANELWGIEKLKTDNKFLEIKKTVLEIASFAPNKDFLKKGLSSSVATTYINDTGETITPEKSNKYNFTSQQPNWAGDFGRLATESITAVITACLQANNKEVVIFVKEVQNSIDENFRYMQEYLEGLGKSISNNNNSLELRNQLLWIKESQFSLCLQISYRDISKIALLFAIAKDISDTITPIYPLSIDFFAKEIARISDIEVDSETTLETILILVQEDTSILPLIPTFKDLIGRQSLYHFIISLYHKKNDISQLTALTGIPKDILITRSELLVWLLHDIQSIKLSNTK